ncbi:carbon-nitrogen hydrolase family protein [Archaeoglobus sp.]
MKIRVTVCELSDKNFWKDWDELTQHVNDERSDLVVLPETPAYPWFASLPQFNEKIWQKAIKAHDDFISKLNDFPAVIISTRPIQKGDQRLNQAFFWDKGVYHPVRCKYYLPEEEGFYEVTWFHKGAKDFHTVKIRNAVIGILICSELMFNEWARLYGKQGAHIIAVPRATFTVDRWLVASRMAGIVSGAFVLSSNRVGGSFGGRGWVVSPEGDVIAVTSRDEPFVTVNINLKEAELAKQTYPRNILE